MAHWCGTLGLSTMRRS
ncbi:hypothetical protein LINPERPRIM_LOCUS33011 [Linum perenne]